MSTWIGPRTAAIAMAIAGVTVIVVIALAGGGDPPSPAGRFMVGELAVTVDDATVTLAGPVPSAGAAGALVDAVAGRDDVVAVIDQLVIDPAARLPATETVHTGLDALLPRPD